MKHNSKKAYRVVKDFTTERKGKVSTIKDEKWNYHTKEYAIMSRWTEYSTELCNDPVTGDTTTLNVIDENKEPQLPILRHDIEAAVNSLKMGK